MNKFQLTFTALQLPVDIATLSMATVFAYLLRYSRYATEIRPILQDIPLTTYIQLSITFIAIWISVFIIAGLYSTRHRKAWDEFGRIILACTIAVLILIASIFFKRELTQSRFIIIAIWGLSVFFVSFGRLILRAIQHQLLKMKIGHENIIIIGKDESAKKLAETFDHLPILGFSVIKHVIKWNEEIKQSLKKLIEKKQITGILLADPDMPKSDALHIIGFANKYHLHFWYAADVFAARFTNISVSTPGGIPLIEVKPTPLDGWGRIAKRIMDIFFAIIIFTLSSPLWLFGAILVLIEDGLPIIYKNERIGEKGKSFITYKLRTMYKKYSIGPQFSNTKKNLELEQKLIKEQGIKKDAVYKIANDPRIIKTGHFLRRWSIDEFPNFISVLKGDMSLVGPRPHQPREVEKYSDEERRVLTIKPGVTGLAQISGRSNLTWTEEARLDIWYIENWSPLLDLYILIKTPFAVIQKTGAY